MLPVGVCVRSLPRTFRRLTTCPQATKRNVRLPVYPVVIQGRPGIKLPRK
jgi:hypothetical protein